METPKEIKKYPPINEKLPHFYHGGDYSPEQWLKYPEILEEDIRLMKLAKCNVMSVGVFSWVTLEPQEGVFNFEWLDRILDSLYTNGIYFSHSKWCQTWLDDGQVSRSF